MILKLAGYQKDAIDALAEIGREALERAADNPGLRARLALSSGYSLLEAPTGSGKTFIMGRALEALAKQADVVVFWFAPFEGVVAQTRRALAEACPGLRVVDPRFERSPSSARSGDVHVLTWASVAATRVETRKLRQDGDLPSIDTFLKQLKADGRGVVAVADEAHHSFRPGTMAFGFWRDVLQPDVALLATATPGDADLAALQRALHVTELNRVTVSRQQAVDADLVKPRAATVICTPRNRATGAVVLDPAEVALRSALKHHEALKLALAEAGVALTPLLLVQAASERWTPEIVRDFLVRDCRVDRSKVAVHTADLPDPQLHLLAGDESKEILVFKMAVATGFDAPRAFSLAALRNIADADFGTQIIGRVMRVHAAIRLHPGRRLLPPIVDTATVFLASPESQEGLQNAAAKLQALRPGLARVVGRPSIVISGAGAPVLIGLNDDLVSALMEETPVLAPKAALSENGAEAAAADIADLLNGLWAPPPRPSSSLEKSLETSLEAPRIRAHAYKLRTTPPSLKTERLPEDTAVLVERVAASVQFTDRHVALHGKTLEQVIQEDRDLFAETRVRENVAIEISERRIAEAAQLSFAFSSQIEPHRIALALRERLKARLAEAGHRFDDGSLSRTLNLIMAMERNLIARSWRQQLAMEVVAVDAGALPDAIYSLEPLESSRRNIYGVIPPGLNTWERRFVEVLDDDLDGIVLWWHRNPSQRTAKTPYAVEIVRPDGYGFYPDFVVGVDGRRTESNIALAEIKERINDRESILKNRTSHKVYQAAKMLFYEEGSDRWRLIQYDPEAESNIYAPGLFSLDSLRAGDAV